MVTSSFSPRYLLAALAATVAAAMLAGCGGSQALAPTASGTMLLGFVDRRLTELEAGREHTEQQEYDRVVGALRAQLGSKFDSVAALGSEWTEDGAAAVVVALEL